MERWIEAGRVSIGGRIAMLGDVVTEGDRICVDGRAVAAKRLFPATTRIIGLNKRAGCICTRADPQGRPTVFDGLPPATAGRWVNIGRLDIETSGLLLFTDNGELAHRLAHPSFEVEREYAVRVLGELNREQMRVLKQGVELDDGIARVVRITPKPASGANRWYHLVLTEGRNREIRRIFDSFGLTVSRLIRIRFGPINLSRSLRGGTWWELSPAERTRLMRLVDLSPQGGAGVSRTPYREKKARRR